MGWNWCIHLAEECELFIITEGEFRTDIEKALPTLPQSSRMHFYYLPVSTRIRKMCWDQGDWRFYFHYACWQHRARALAKSICASNKIDIIHQLNMVGFREPGFLWAIKGPAFIWGPIGGMALTPVQYFRDAPLSSRCKMVLKNGITLFQRKWSPRVRSAIKHAHTVICATPIELGIVSGYFKKKAVCISETGAPAVMHHAKERSFQPPYHLVWVGKFMHRKQLGLALSVMEALKDEPVILDVAGTGTDEECARYRRMAEKMGITDKIAWHGQVPQEAVYGIMNRADLFFFTSVHETTSTVIMEALSCGLPVICFDACGFGPLVDSTLGIKIPLSTPEQSVGRFAQAIQKLISQPDLLPGMSAQASIRAQTLNWDTKITQVLQVYKDALDTSV